MTNSYISGGALGQQLRRLGLTALLAGGTALAAQAQSLNYSATTAANTTSTFTDLGATGTVIATANSDDANSAAQNIGFTFAFNGASFSQFVLNTNGLIRLGNAAPSAGNMFLQNETGAAAGVDPITSTDGADVNLLMPFNFDLEAGTGASPGTGIAEYRMATTGTSPNQVCTIQWKNVHDKAATNASQYASVTFQAKLYEGSNRVEFVYTPVTVTTTGTEIGRYATIGIKGSGSATGQDVLVSKGSSATVWSGATFITGTSPRVFFRRSVGPDAGRTFRFDVAAANDAAVTAVYTLGKLPSAALPSSAVQAVVTNSGSATLTGLVVSLNVTGANTFTNTQTVASLAAGTSTTVTFAALPATFVAGVNTITVSVPADANNTNNSATTQQTVNTTGTFSYVPSDQTTTPGAFVVGSAATGGIFATRYTTATAGTVTSVSVYLGDAGASTTTSTTVGKTVYGVILSSTGTILGQSANYVVQTADIGTYHTFAITTPPAVAASSSFLAGLAQPVTTALRYYPLVIQTENPTRSNTYFTVPLAGGTPTDLAASNSSFGRLMMEATVNTTLATSKELLRAVTIYPNPSATGVFNLDIRNANAHGLLGVEVTNQLGQRVYTGSAHDNLTNSVDLSNLAAGLYHLQVRNGGDFASRQISIVK